MFKRLRIALLLYILLFVGAATYLAGRRSTDWDAPLWVDVYPVSGDGSQQTDEYLDRLSESEFGDIEEFFAREAKRYDVALDRPFRVSLAERLEAPPPDLAKDSSMLDTLLWSLRTRWFATRVQWRSSRPAPDIVVFAVFHDATTTVVIDRSMALEKGLIAVAHLYAARSARGSNQVVLAHELLHTLGATDKYALGSGIPLHPHGFADPDAVPLYPQRAAELMAGRIAVAPRRAEIPQSLRDVMVGALTAAEIGWARPK